MSAACSKVTGSSVPPVPAPIKWSRQTAWNRRGVGRLPPPCGFRVGEAREDIPPVVDQGDHAGDDAAAPTHGWCWRSYGCSPWYRARSDSAVPQETTVDVKAKADCLKWGCRDAFLPMVIGAISILATPLEGHRRCGYPAIGVRFHPETLILRHGRTEFLPLFSGEFLENEVRKNGGKITGIFGSYIPK
jgi:hypothetical protein